LLTVVLHRWQENTTQTPRDVLDRAATDVIQKQPSLHRVTMTYNIDKIDHAQTLPKSQSHDEHG